MAVDSTTHLKVVFFFGSRIWLQERQALLPVVPVVGVVEVEVREGKENKALNREQGDVVEESEDEGRLVHFARCCHVFVPAAQVDLAEHIILAEAVDLGAVVRFVLRTWCHLDLQVDLSQFSTFGVPNLTKLADVCVKQPRF